MNAIQTSNRTKTAITQRVDSATGFICIRNFSHPWLQYWCCIHSRLPQRAGGRPFGNDFLSRFRNCGCSVLAFFARRAGHPQFLRGKEIKISNAGPPVRESPPAVEMLKETRQSLQRV